jgi:hypothetical protein
MKYKAYIFFLLFLQVFAYTCDVPVFRYTLERWDRDLYRK